MKSPFLACCSFIFLPVVASWAITPPRENTITRAQIALTAFAAVDDTYVVDWEGGAGSYGTRALESTLRVAKSDIRPKRYVAYVRFDEQALMQAGPSPRRAILRLRRAACGPDPLDGIADYGVHVVYSTWHGSELDGRSLPPFGPSIDFQRPQDAAWGTWIEWEVTTALRNNLEQVAKNGFAIDVDDIQVNHSHCELKSIEGGDPPELVVDSAKFAYLPQLLRLNPGQIR